MPTLTKRKQAGDGPSLSEPRKRIKTGELPEEERIEQDAGVPLAAESSLVFSDGEEDGGVRLAPAAVVQDGHDDNDDDNDDDDFYEPDDLDQLAEADDEDTDWDEEDDEDEEETAGPTGATRAESGEVLDQYAPDGLPSVDPNRVDCHQSSNENCF